MMADELTREDVERIAELASLELTERRDRHLHAAARRDPRLRAADPAVDTTGVPPTSHVLAGQPVDRDDEPLPSLDRARALEGAPDAAPDAGLFRVPRVIG